MITMITQFYGEDTYDTKEEAVSDSLAKAEEYFSGNYDSRPTFRLCIVDWNVAKATIYIYEKDRKAGKIFCTLY